MVVEEVELKSKKVPFDQIPVQAAKVIEDWTGRPFGGRGGPPTTINLHDGSPLVFGDKIVLPHHVMGSDDIRMPVIGTVNLRLISETVFLVVSAKVYERIEDGPACVIVEDGFGNGPAYHVVSF